MPLNAPEPVKKSFKLQMLQAREVAITRAVNRLLAEKGFDAMTVDEVAAEVGIAKACTSTSAAKRPWPARPWCRPCKGRKSLFAV